MVESDVGLVWQFLRRYPSVIAVIDPSFPAAFPDCTAGQLVSSLIKLGFSEVMEGGFGAEMVGQAYARLLTENKDRVIFSSTCPAIVSYIEKYFPQLIDHLAPIVSPMIAMGRLIKRQYNPQAKVVYIGPCVAIKDESMDEQVAGVIDAVITFPELMGMFVTQGIDAVHEDEEPFSGPRPHRGRLFPVSGGLMRVLGTPGETLLTDVINASGKDYSARIHYSSRLLQEVTDGDITAKFINMGFCQGCIDGPFVGNDQSVAKRRELIANYGMSDSDPEQTERDLQEYAEVDLSRKFTNLTVTLPTPKEEDVERLLRQMGRSELEDQFNCGACGYDTCAQLAIAVCQGLAEAEMCWPYVVDKLKTTQEDLIQAEKLTSLGQMAASIAHEVNNPLAGVLIYTQLLSKKIANDKFAKDNALDYLNKMESELNRSTRLIRNLLDFARQSPPALRLVNVNEVVDRAIGLAAHSAQLQNIEVNLELEPSIPKIMADFDQLQQVCTNLILNAIQAMPDSGQLTLRTSSGDDQVKIEVADSGMGIPQEHMRKLFTPFFTTKEKGKGVGLGLAVAYGIIQRHHGRIEVNSEEGVGTTFSITLPQHYEESEDKG